MHAKPGTSLKERRIIVYYYIVLCWALTGLHFAAAAAAGEISPRLSKLAKPKKLRPKPFSSSAKLTEKK